MIWSFNFWFGVAIFSVVLFYQNDLDIKTIVIYCTLALINFIFATQEKKSISEGNKP